MLWKPPRSPRSGSRRFPGGDLRSFKARAEFRISNFCSAERRMFCEKERTRRVERPWKRSSVARSPKDAITAGLPSSTPCPYLNGFTVSMQSRVDRASSPGTAHSAKRIASAAQALRTCPGPQSAQLACLEKQADKRRGFPDRENTSLGRVPGELQAEENSGFKRELGL